MSDSDRHPIEDLRATSRLATDAVQGLTALVEELHRTIGSGPAVLGKPLEGPVGAATRVIYGGIGSATGVVGAGVDRALERLTPLLQAAEPSAEHEAVLAAVNGVLGDYLHATESPLAIPMRLRVQGRAVSTSPEALARGLPQRGPRLLVTVHGSSMNDRQWLHQGRDHAAELALELELGFTRIDVHYNTGRHISDNGEELAGLLQDLLAAWPGPAVEELVLLCHSMGGLVARSAVDHAERTGLDWRARVVSMVFLGTPHHGSPIERAGNVVDILLGVSRYSAPFRRLARIRSAGVTDLRHGFLRRADWADRDRFVFRPDMREVVPLPEGVSCFAVAGRTRTGAAAALPGDGLVPVKSALGQHKKARYQLNFSDSHRMVAEGVSHLGLLSDPAVYAQLRTWLSSTG